jgi:carbonic anhydrase
MNITSQEALTRLREGNRRFADGHPRTGYSAEERAAALQGQRPFAVIVGCSDSRVPVEAVFDAGPGELFVVRTAGHVLALASVASVRFAVEKLGVRLIVVLGHEDCGAVHAALAGETPEWLEPIVGRIRVEGIEPADAVVEHVRDTVQELRDWTAVLTTTGIPEIAGATFALESGEVHWLD